MLFRQCTRCRRLKDPLDFETRISRYKDRVYTYYRGECRECRTAGKLAWKKANPERARGPREGERRRNLRWEAAHKERVMISRRAADRVRYALKTGRLVKPDACQECGKSGRIQAAHSDYSRPLDVRWLCVSCHVRWDHAFPKT